MALASLGSRASLLTQSRMYEERRSLFHGEALRLLVLREEVVTGASTCMSIAQVRDPVGAREVGDAHRVRLQPGEPCWSHTRTLENVARNWACTGGANLSALPLKKQSAFEIKHSEDINGVPVQVCGAGLVGAVQNQVSFDSLHRQGSTVPRSNRPNHSLTDHPYFPVLRDARRRLRAGPW